MSLKLYPTDVLLYIMSFLDNKTNSNIVSTCRVLRQHGKNNGYINKIKANYSVDMREFLSLFCVHTNTIKTVTIDGFENPHLWVPIFRENMFFTHCSFPTRLSPGKGGRSTKYIVLTDYHRFKNKLTLEIDWEDFPNLEELELYVYSVNMKGIDNCKKLKRVKINTINYKISGDIDEKNLWPLLVNPPQKRKRCRLI